jgi:hypothetical protein
VAGLDALFLSFYDELLGPLPFHFVPLGEGQGFQEFCARNRRKVARLAAIPAVNPFFTRDFSTFVTASVRTSVRSEWTHSARQFLTLMVATETRDPSLFRGVLEAAAARLQELTDVASAVLEKSRPNDVVVQAASAQLKDFLGDLGADICQRLA